MSEQPPVFDKLLRLAVENKASDIHIKSASPAFLRISGRLDKVDMDLTGMQQSDHLQC